MQSSLIHLFLLCALLWVVISDLLYRRISNRLVLALLTGWAAQFAWLALRGGPVDLDGVATGGLVGLGVLFVGYGLFAMRWVGAGDVKLVSVLCLWLGRDAFAFLVATSLLGGVLALGLPLLRRVEQAVALCAVRLAERFPALGLGVPMALRGEAAQVRGIPYGLAIAAGAAGVLWGYA